LILKFSAVYGSIIFYKWIIASSPIGGITGKGLQTKQQREILQGKAVKYVIFHQASGRQKHPNLKAPSFECPQQRISWRSHSYFLSFVLVVPFKIKNKSINPFFKIFYL
jgi:hypothetical protein